MISEPKKVENELTIRKLSSPFKSEKKIKGHRNGVYDSTTATFPDGQKRIITCSTDGIIRIFNLEEEKCEKIIKHSTSIYSVHFYKEEHILMITDDNGELLIWKLFPEIKNIRRIKVSKTNSELWRLTQISTNKFFCCVDGGKSSGSLYQVNFGKYNNEFISKEIECPTINNNNKKESLSCIYQLITQKNMILFAGGNYRKRGGEDFHIKSINLNNNNKFQRYPKMHNGVVSCLTSFINTKNEEIVLSGGYDNKIIFMNLLGEYVNNIKFSGIVHCFLNDFSRNNIFVIGGYLNNMNIYSFSDKIVVEVKRAHKGFINCVKWIDEKIQNQFISCSNDKTFNIYQLENNNNNNNNNNNVKRRKKEPNINKDEIIKKLKEEIKKSRSDLRKAKNEVIRNLKIEKKKSRLDLKIEEIKKEEFFHFDPTKYSTVFGKLNFHHNIGKRNSIFVCNFKPSKSNFKTKEDYLRQERLSLFENVIVNQKNDKKLENFIKKMISKFPSGLGEKNQKKEITNIIKNVLLFFQPTPNKEEENEGESEEESEESQDEENIPLTIFQATEKTVKEETTKGIIQSARKKEGLDNNVFLGDLENYYGLCRHRSTLFKVVCDALNIRCKLVFIYGYHAWNMIQLENEFYYVDLMNSPNIINVETYNNHLRKIVENPRNDKNIRNSIQHILNEHDLEEEKTFKLKEFFLRKKHKDYFEVLPIGKKGGGGDISILRIKKNKKIFSKGKILAVKKIKVRNEEEEEEEDRINRKYAIREARNMKILDHPSIIKIIGYFENIRKNELYLCMVCMDQDGKDFIDTLCDKLKNEEMTHNQVFIESILFFLEVSRGLRYLSNLKIVHLDLKPENIMINWDNEKNEIMEVKIIDFGGAKNEDIYTSGMSTTKEYDSPEIAGFKESNEILKLFYEYKKNRKLKANDFKTLRNRMDLMESSVTRLNGVFKYLINLSKKRPNIYRLAKEWKTDFNKKLIFEEFSNLSEFDCRADIYSFGIMMDDFFKKNLLPFELEDLKEKCLRNNRRDRCSVDEIIFVLRNHLSFFNQKMKESDIEKKE